MFIFSLIIILGLEVLLEAFARATADSIVGPAIAHLIMIGLGLYALYELLHGWIMWPFRDWYNRHEDERRTKEAEEIYKNG